MPVRRPPRIGAPQPAAVLNRDDPLLRGLLASIPFAEGAGNIVRVHGARGKAASSAGGGPLKFVSGPRDGKALTFGATNDALVVPSYTSTWSVGTLVWWARPSAANSGFIRAMVSYGTASNNELSCQIYVDNNWYVGWMNAGTDYRVTLASNSTNYAVGVWSQYAITWDAAGTKFFQNGNLLGTNGTAPVVPAITGTLTLGIQGTYNATSNYVGWGALGHLQMWTRALRQPELRELWGNPWRLYAQPRRRGLASAAVSTTANLTQIALEQWAQGMPNAQMTQMAMEMWAASATGTTQALMTQIAIEQWAAAGVAAQVAQARAIIMA